MNKINIGIIGCGGISNVHSLSLIELCKEYDTEVTAFADVLPERRAFMAERFPDARPYNLGMELIERERPDVVYVCLPTYMHAEHTIAALDRGINVFLEKPACLKRSEAAQLLDAERRSGKKIMIGHSLRYRDEYMRLKSLCDSGRYGKLKGIFMQRIAGIGRSIKEPKRVTWYDDPGKSGTFILDLHIHDVDFIRSLLGDPLSVNVVSDIGSKGPSARIAAIYRYDGAFAYAESGKSIATTFWFKANYRAVFEYATAVYDSVDNKIVTVFDCEGHTITLDDEWDAVTGRLDGGRGGNRGASGAKKLFEDSSYYAESSYFLDCVINDKTVENPSLSDSIKTFELVSTELEMAYAQAGLPFPIKEN